MGYFFGMCNRYVPAKRVYVKVREHVFEGEFSFEKALPTDLAPIVFSCGLKEMRWGWRVPWDRKPLTNAKCETLTKLEIYQPHLEQRCLIPATGFFEKGVEFRLAGGGMFAMAGLWRTEDGMDRFTMLTTTPNQTVEPYHNRMPFLLRPEDFERWLMGDWLEVLARPDKSPLEKVVNQPELF